MLSFHPYVYNFLIGYVVFYVIALAMKIPSLWYDSKCPWRKTQLTIFQRCMFHGISQFAKYWHGYEVHYPENMNSVKQREVLSNALLVGYHSRPTLDLVYLTMTIQPKFVIYHITFKLPGMNHILEKLGGIPSAKPDNEGKTKFIKSLTEDPRPLIVLPGGAFECAKMWNERYKAMFKNDPGFARTIVQDIYNTEGNQKTCVVPFHTKNCENCYWTSEWWYDLSGKWIRYSIDRINQGDLWIIPILVTFALPGLGFVLLPRPIKLDTYMGEPIYPKPKESSEEFGERVRDKLQQLIDRVEAIPVKKHSINYFRIFKVSLIVLITIIQNAIAMLLLYSTAWTLLPIAVILYYLVTFFNRFSHKKSVKNL